MMTTYVILIALFCLSHSLMVTAQLKKHVYRYISQSTYRLIFNLISVAFLVAIIWTYSNLEQPILFSFNGQASAGWILVLLGSALSLLSFMSYNTAEFIGLAKENINQKLSVTGMNRHIRHPLYLSTFVILWSALLIEPTLAYLGFAGAMTVYIIIGTRLEESKLIEAFGQEYRDYQNRVPMFIPSIMRNK